jgi:tetratricopeptide (TPR) repeat protein
MYCLLTAHFLQGDVHSARTILSEAFKANPNSEQIWLAAVKLESECGEHDRARMLLKKAREQAPTPRVWMKAAVLERQLDNLTEALELVKQGLEKYPTADKLWMMRGQLEEALNQASEARASLAKGVSLFHYPPAFLFLFFCVSLVPFRVILIRTIWLILMCYSPLLVSTMSTMHTAMDFICKIGGEVRGRSARTICS